MTRSAHPARTLIAAAVLAGSAGLAAACSSPGSPAPPPGATATAASVPSAETTATSPASSSPGSPSPPPATAPSGPQPCASSALQVSVGASQGAAAGSSFYPIDFTNNSGTSCTLYGYPGVSFVTGVGGSQIGIPATENPANPRRLITLAPGQTGHAEFQVVDAQNYPPAACDMVTAHWLRVYPPNQTAPLYTGFTAQACTKPRPILSVQTVQTGASGT